MIIRNLAVLLSLAYLVSFSVENARAAGLEKSIGWSGKWAPLAGAASSGVTGSESLYFNPAGLAANRGLDATINVSPIFPKFQGPIAGTQYESGRPFVPAFGIFASMAPIEKWGFGLGLYASGGAKAEYESVKPRANAQANEIVKVELTMVEASLGAAYEIIDGLRFGASYRAVFVSGAFSSLTPYAPLGEVYTNFDNLKDTAWNGFRLGLQYAPKESRWGLGATWRTQVDFGAKGDLNGGFVSALNGARIPLSSGGGSVSTSLPQQFTVAGHWEFLERQRIFAQYDFLEYHKLRGLNLTGVLTGVPSTPIPMTELPLDFNNVNVYRLAYQCNSIENWSFRLGYALTSPSSPKSTALATLEPPAYAHSVTLGAGTSFLAGALEVNGGVEYDWSKGTVGADTPARGIRTSVGDYKVDAYTLHLGSSFHI